MGTQAARANADATNPPVDDRSDGLKVGLESTRADVVGVADLTPHDRTLTADFTTLGHIFLLESVDWMIG
jgi:hypothetical protein